LVDVPDEEEELVPALALAPVRASASQCHIRQSFDIRFGIAVDSSSATVLDSALGATVGGGYALPCGSLAVPLIVGALNELLGIDCRESALYPEAASGSMAQAEPDNVVATMHYDEQFAGTAPLRRGDADRVRSDIAAAALLAADSQERRDVALAMEISADSAEQEQLEVYKRVALIKSLGKAAGPKPAGTHGTVAAQQDPESLSEIMKALQRQSELQYLSTVNQIQGQAAGFAQTVQDSVDKVTNKFDAMNVEVRQLQVQAKGFDSRFAALEAAVTTLQERADGTREQAVPPKPAQASPATAPKNAFAGSACGPWAQWNTLNKQQREQVPHSRCRIAACRRATEDVIKFRLINARRVALATWDGTPTRTS
jgi:hypothetical protein